MEEIQTLTRSQYPPLTDQKNLEILYNYWVDLLKDECFEEFEAAGITDLDVKAFKDFSLMEIFRQKMKKSSAEMETEFPTWYQKKKDIYQKFKQFWYFMSEIKRLKKKLATYDD